MLKRRMGVRALFASLSIALLIPASPAHAAVAPTAPTGITVTAGQGSVSVQWAAPSYSGDGVSSYSIYYSTDGSSWSTAATGITGSGPYVVSGLTPGTPYYIRMTATGSGGTSPYGYPWKKLYSVSNPTRDSSDLIVYDSNFGLGNSDPYKVDSLTAFTRVKYHMQFDTSGATSYADADMDKWGASTPPNSGFSTVAATVQNLRVPTLTSTGGNTGDFTIQTNVSDLTVVASDSTLNASGKTGRLEIWATDYGYGPSGLTPTYPGANGAYDYDDLPAAGSYGSFQVHNATDGKTILAWNHHVKNLTPDLGFGSSPINQPDWTFCYTNGNCPSRTNFNLQILVNAPTVAGAILNTTVSLSGGTGAIYRSAISLTATASTTGKVTFYANNKKIPGCINISTAGSSPFIATCSWRPASHNSVPLKAIFKPYTGNNSTSTTINPIVGKRVSNR